MAKSFPEQQHSKYTPDGSKASHIGSSQGVGAGHQEHDRMPPPNQDWHQGSVKPSDNFGKSGTKTNHQP